MKIKNSFIRLTTVVFLLLVSIILAACAPKIDPPTKGGNPPKDPGPNPGPTVPVPDPKTPISDLFSRYKVITSGQNVTIADPTTGTVAKFNDLLDRQIDVLATDILYRLAVVYGNGFINPTDVIYKLNTSYSYSGDNAEVDGKNIILPQINGDYYSESYQRIRGIESGSPIIDDAGYFAYALRTGVWTELISQYFNNIHTIAGGHFWDVDSERFDSDLGLNTSYAWNWNYTGTEIDHRSTNKVFENYIYAYKENLKSAIAQILASAEIEDINHHNDYKNYLNDINYLGFTAGDRQKIENFVLNEVIGTYNINSDEAIYKRVVCVLGGNVLSDSTINETFLETEELHYYKAYNVLVPKMLERAFSNSFGGKEVNRIVYADAPANTTPVLVDGKVQYSSLDELENITNMGGAQFVSLYPKMTRSKDTDLNIVEQEPNTNDAPEFLMLGVYEEIKSVILQPKQGSFATGLFMAVSAEEGVTIDFKINLKYVAKGVEHANGYVPQFVTGTQTTDIYRVSGKYDTTYGESLKMPYYFALDIAGLISTDPYPIFDNYDGIDSGNQNLWNNPYSFNGYKLAGDNYLEISFEIVNAIKNNQIYNGEVKFDIGFADPY